MTRFKIVVASAALLAVGSGSVAVAGPVGVARGPISVTTQETIWQLSAAKQDAEHQALVAVKGSAATNSRFKALRLDEMIQRVERGERVSPEEVEEALQN